ncbi:MAG TPA: ATP-dependent Clp protease adaptor ClpS [Fimbriimonadaceae bacterium]|nr:ATP-dependent Clp protease adaptor ClpS [Fimbriimonadaceae bacterium]
MARTYVQPEVLDNGVGTGRWMVVIYNNDVTTFDEVIAILMRSTGCSLQEASIEAWEAHHFGRAPVHFSSRNECEIIAAMISSIGVQTQVRREWDEE